jgi:hypothetical protein
MFRPAEIDALRTFEGQCPRDQRLRTWWKLAPVIGRVCHGGFAVEGVAHRDDPGPSTDSNPSNVG